MAFERVSTRIATDIGLIRITLRDGDGTNPSRSVNFRADVLDQNAAYMGKVDGDLRPHLTGAQLQVLVALMDVVRAKAADEILE